MVSTPPRTSTNSIATSVPGFRILIRGQQLRSDVMAVIVDENVSTPTMFTIKLANWDQEQQEWIDPQLFKLGNEVTIFMGYGGSRGKLQKLMVGQITGLEPEFAHGEIPLLTVRGYDYSHRLLRGYKTRSFTKKKDSDIARDIAKQAGLKYGGVTTTLVLDYVLQHDQTDMEFLKTRAQRLGYEVVVQDKTLYFRPHQDKSKSVLTLVQRKDLLSFSSRLTSLTQVGQVEVRGWNPKDKKAFIGRSNPGFSTNKSGAKAVDQALGSGKKTSERLYRPVFSREEAEQIAQGGFNNMALEYIRGEGLCVGRADLRAGSVITIQGVGKQFSGDYYVTCTTHTYSQKRGYRTAFKVRRNGTS
ncbi:contractile injection system protein, VgrG/Pvc8 family [Moorena producens JHB]|uniref:Contractile injection system protein, VgrG/Pvc8 family n=1 Tax=Moorena producens (strain JHB) TaxID=1454205 RepID=A0A1D9G2M6_MOOP1|nr:MULTISPECIES: contractile injection system protein, VgrG/Pvc8 family [Moorena]AOY81863.1 contractile injection system protein, VgrG/Pvc8 family [Moorena producens JHB]NEQ06249.1 phage late control D family protein [Moorena sp. SIO4E2]